MDDPRRNGGFTTTCKVGVEWEIRTFLAQSTVTEGISAVAAAVANGREATQANGSKIKKMIRHNMMLELRIRGNSLKLFIIGQSISTFSTAADGINTDFTLRI
jgi:hypothetical protein